MKLSINSWIAVAFLISFSLLAEPLKGQSQTLLSGNAIPTVSPSSLIPSPLPPKQKPLLTLPSRVRQTPEIQNENQNTIKVQRFVFKGNTVFSTEQLEAVVAPFKGREITFAELLQARAVVTKLYIKAGYITSGAFIPLKENQEIQSNGGSVTVQVVEGTLEKINVSGSSRLQGYIRSRLKGATSPALNRNRLEEALRLLQADPKIEAISANLIAGSQIDKTLLDVDVKAKQSFRVETSLDNERSPAVGTLQRTAQITQANLLGPGDELSLGYRNTDGSDAIQTSYTLPINSGNGTLQFDYADISSDVVERPFNELDIISDSRSYELSLRQPLLQKASDTSTKEFALGLTASRQESETALLNTPYPLSLGADDRGRTKISALRFFQDWTQRSGREVLFARSQFSLGVGALDATLNANEPDSRFFAWRGQALWLRRLAENTTLLLRADMQLADRSLVPLEQFSLGGAQTVRGYRQDALLGDSGFLISAELRIPLVSSQSGGFQIIPFVDLGTTWDDSDRESEITDTLYTDTLASVGLGLQYQLGDRLTTRLDWGIPLNEIPDSNSTWQENGIYFSLRFQPF